MNISRMPNNDLESTTMLGNLTPGNTFRFATLTFDQAISENEFYIVVKAPEKKERVLIVNIATGDQLVRDREHRVVEHTIDTRVIE